MILPFVATRFDPLLLAGRCVPHDVLAFGCANGDVQLSVTEDSLRAYKSVEESLMNTLQRTIDGYEACVLFRPAVLVFD